jgi:hypothetical protein
MATYDFRFSIFCIGRIFMVRRTLLFLLTLSSLAANARAATVSLNVALNKVAHTYQVFATINGPSDGLASFDIDVLGTGGAAVSTSVNNAPRVIDFNGNGDNSGFALFRTNGTTSATNKLDIRASQDTTQSDPGFFIFGVGTQAPFLPVLLASGAYTGSVGLLTAQLHPGNSFNLFPAGFEPGGSTVAATSVFSGSAAVPEPATVALLGMGIVMVGAAAYRRRAAKATA